MPQEANSKAPKRWEGTHTYPKGNLTRKRTVGQIREEAAKRIQADREKRRIGVDKLRRNSIGNIPVSTGEDPEEIFFDADGEEMPGSNKKKKHNSGGPQDAPSPMEQGARAAPASVDPAMLELLMSIKKDINDTTTNAVGKINARIDENAKAIEKAGDNTAVEIRKLRQHVDESQARLEEKLTKQIEDRNIDIERRLTTLENKKTPPATLTRPNTDATPKQQEAYAKARRTLKMWPITGTDLEDSVKVFLKTKLAMEDDRIRALGTINVKPSIGKAARDKSEVLAMFECREDRDYVKSLGFNLAKDKESGMTIHVPGHLLDNLYALSSVGYNIRQNQEGVKRSIKFNDAIQDIYLDIFIGGKWKKIVPAEARAALKAAPPTATSGSGTGISAEDLISLVKGDTVPGLTTVVIPADADEATMQQ